MSEPALNLPDAQDPSAKRRCVSQSAPIEEMPNADWVFRVGTEEKRAHHHHGIAIMYSFVSSR